jgi:hypothetical protein
VVTKADLMLALSVRTACPAKSRGGCPAATGLSKTSVSNFSADSYLAISRHRVRRPHCCAGSSLNCGFKVARVSRRDEGDRRTACGEIWEASERERDPAGANLGARRAIQRQVKRCWWPSGKPNWVVA